MSKYNLNFHNTFLPDRAYLSKILDYADEINNLTKEEISRLTGIPTGKSSGKVLPHIEYLKFMNLIDYSCEKGKYSIKRSQLGEKVFKEDIYINEKITKLMLNYFLTSKYFGAQMWNYIFRELVYIYGSLIDNNIIKSEVENYYSKKVNLSAFNSTYNNINSFNDLNILNIDKKLYKFNSTGFEYEGLYMYLYTLLSELEKIDEKRKEFTYDEIFKVIKWHLGFQWSIDEAISILERFETKNLVLINRQLNPVTVILKMNCEDILKEIYSLLI